MLKYVYEYGCPPDYEPGYVRAHNRNSELYKAVADAFDRKKCVGVRVYNNMKKVVGADLPTILDRDFTHADEKRITCMAFNCEERMLTANTIPTVYEGEGVCGIAFGENARYLPEAALENGLILDAKAALILEGRGVNVGLASADSEPCRFMELFCDSGYCHLEDTDRVCPLTPRSGARVLAHYVDVEMYSGEKRVSAYAYENEKGQRFLVYGFDAEGLKPSSSLFWSYKKGKQLAELIPWLGGDALPVTCTGHPLLYQICKMGEGRIAAALLNCHEDEVWDAEIRLASPIGDVRFIGCEGERISDTLLKIKNIKAFGFAAVEVTIK